MGIALFVVLQSLFGLACHIAIGVCGFILVDRRARPEVRGPARVLVTMLMFAVGGVAVIWERQLSVHSGSQWQHLEKRRCIGEAGETIYRAVENVPGVFYQAPPRARDAGHFHSDDSKPEKYLDRPARRYDFFEVQMGADLLVRHHARVLGKTVETRIDAPTARYAFTWTPLQSQEEANAGIYGEELEVFDRQTREVLARRVVFYSRPTGQTRSRGVAALVCPQIALPTDPAYIDGQPRDSYSFVSRVLKPQALKSEESAQFFSLARGGGRRTEECVGGYVWIGEGISPGNLAFERQRNDLLMTVIGTEDSLLCQSFFSSAGSSGNRIRIRFADGGSIAENEIRGKTVRNK